MTMLVRAVRLGYYGLKRRKPGEVFEIESEKHFSDSMRNEKPGWMERVEGPATVTDPRPLARMTSVREEDAASPVPVPEKRKPGRPRKSDQSVIS